MRPIVIAICLATVAFAEDPAPKKSDAAAEELLKKVEAKIQKAKTVSIRCAAEVTMGKAPMKFDMALDFKEGNRAKMLLTTIAADGKQESGGAACDGKTMRTKKKTGVTEAPAAADFAEKARAMSVRVSLIELSMAFEGTFSKDPLVCSEYAFLPDEKVGDRTARVVAFVATRGALRLDMKLWIDEKQLAVMKREWVGKKGDRESRETVTYSKMTCDEEIPDEVFATNEVKEEGKKDGK
ncbi:MAG: hypothetical protein FD180_78 [Planctomycetota bacterium]|nr:MAG: hypothetical protein FD180_78 [Planctomycetota bacterium]